ncbi:MAG: RNA pseudouridine synthase [Candidatus Wallbacteria bacterium HGW-Wallbacteria-1]|jgi:23S rRNA pseudouridine1911/1915/1917 synthase|uniref:Pseudouridine synthase n=1 Tax=Candidatus Wallbacteria bacterium HGW-Wallbacteria-1 TaxID=2013854 RepID=A0A2N1PT15_9BACT|nr:MAG: RNA pseudouridine synthase [Candidatus Wallbacteria bacterium HGW-Wallbacteria-1]
MEVIEFRVLRKNRRLDLFLVEVMDLSRSYVQKIIESGGVLVDGMDSRASMSLEPGELVEVTLPEDVMSDFIPEDIPIEILYQDKDIAVVVKPPGISTHPAGNSLNGTLANALMYHIKDLSAINGVFRPGIVHRLDKGTSGVMLVAKSDVAHHSLSAQFAARQIHKEYLALCKGNFLDSVGIIDVAITRCRKDRMKMEACFSGGKEAVTEFRVRERYAGHTLVLCSPRTGRTHQIRVHMDYIGHPLVGDHLYGTRVASSLNVQAPRMMLHAWAIECNHPVSGERLRFESLPPSDFSDVIASLGEQS